MSDEPLPSPLEPEEIPETPRSDQDQDDLGDLRASMMEEEQARLKAKQNSGFLKKVTGMLRRRTGSLPGATGPLTTQETDERIPGEIPAEQVGEALPAWEGPALVEETPNPDDQVSDDLLAEQIEKALTDLADRDETPPPAPVERAPLETRPLFLDEDFETEAPVSDAQAAFLPEDVETAQPEVSPFSAEEIIAEAEKETPAPEAEITDQAGVAAGESLENIPDATQPDSLRAELIPDMTPAALATPRPKSQPNLWQRFMRWLNADEAPTEMEDAHPEVADEMITDRLQRVQSSDSVPSIPGQNRMKDLSTPATFIADEAMDEQAPEIDDASLLEEEWAGKSGPSSDRTPDSNRERVLHIDWGATKQIREEEEFDSSAQPQDGADQDTGKAPSRLSEMVAQGMEETAPAIEEVRSVVLEDYAETEAGHPGLEVEPHLPFWQRGFRWARQHMALIMPLAAGLVILLALAAFQPWNQAPIAQPNTPVPSDLPYPVGLELTGGWFFDIGRSTIINGAWQPKGAEWLDNSQLRRVVALPWNKQSAAVIQTLERGDPINLVFSNNDLMPFLVRSVERLDKSDTEIFTGNDPGLVIFLYGEESDQRWVVLALPK
ncbi:hypothetical protein LARV_03770 [Longilinea arvoryzae]|uniref:Uncharacterized protein n=1 Tax=Longilinea arvoryzae TaxID=360412 RepID=A0A0K8MXP5_9CHLR|nr:hypothetical protein [Longilinea arvoryzae]GAP15975.1 hypothetical protein LARV_03770 [Longilinea arvoryzae]